MGLILITIAHKNVNDRVVLCLDAIVITILPCTVHNEEQKNTYLVKIIMKRNTDIML